MEENNKELENKNNDAISSKSKKEGKIVSNIKAAIKKKSTWISLLIGMLIGILLIYLLGIIEFNNNSTINYIGLDTNKTIATFKGGSLKENELYNEMRKYYPISYVLELTDGPILDKLYNLTDEQMDEINTQADEILSTYELYYGYTEETFLEENGFESKDDFIKYLQLDYRRNLYCIDYFKTLLAQEDIQKYYDDNVYGEINTKHILVEVSDDVTEEQALTTANEIIAKLEKGTSFDDVASEYEDSVVVENVDFDNFDAEALAKEYVEASKALEKDTYTTEPVKTDYGYHIIYCINKADKPSLEEVENDIVEALGTDLETDDPYIRYKALIKLREENGLKFKDSEFEKEYEEYCNEFNNEEAE